MTFAELAALWLVFLMLAAVCMMLWGVLDRPKYVPPLSRDEEIKMMVDCGSTREDAEALVDWLENKITDEEYYAKIYRD